MQLPEAPPTLLGSAPPRRKGARTRLAALLFATCAAAYLGGSLLKGAGAFFLSMPATLRPQVPAVPADQARASTPMAFAQPFQSPMGKVAEVVGAAAPGQKVFETEWPAEAGSPHVEVWQDYGSMAVVAEETTARVPTSRSGSVTMSAEEEPHATVVFLRHGQSEWNAASLFTGWADVELTTLGKNEAAAAATSIWKEGLVIDVAYTSLLKRAQQTLGMVLKITGQEDVTVHQNWRLNERMYGGLTGLNKKETVAKYGDEQVKKWRRSYSDPPPPIDTSSEYWPGNDNKYAHIPEADIPLAECLKDTVDRCLPYWKGSIVPALGRGKTVLVAAHGNSIRGMLKYLDNISDEDITKLEIPTGVPLVYRLDKDLKVIPSPKAVAPLSGAFLIDEAELKKKQEQVANESKLRYGVEGEAK